jgi:hypothetical protein
VLLIGCPAEYRQVRPRAAGHRPSTLALLFVSVAVPLMIHFVLINLRMSPIPPTDLQRCVHLLVPIGIQTTGLAVACLLRRDIVGRVVAACLACLIAPRRLSAECESPGGRVAAQVARVGWWTELRRLAASSFRKRW